MIKTSLSDPLKIAFVSGGVFAGAIGVTFAPGKKDQHSLSGAWDRDLAIDLDAVSTWKARVVVTLIEAHEFELLGIRSLGDEVRRRSMEWLHLPIRDVSIPDAAFDAGWPDQSKALRNRLNAGENVLIHCRGGLGRAGMIAARLLVDEGMEPEAALAQVRLARPGAIETSEQEKWVRKSAASWATNRVDRPIARGASARANARLAPSVKTAAASDPQRDRALGAFIGLAIGDALGTTIEFSRRDTYPPVVDLVGGGPFKLKPGEWTDDTSMALCLADSLLASNGVLDPSDLARRFLRWLDEGENSVTGRCFDIGVTTRTALESFRRTGSPVGDKSGRAAGNGGIMRLAPAALVAGGDQDRSAALARAQSAVTHAAEECLASAEVMGRILAAGIAGRGLDTLQAAARAEIGSPNVQAIANGAWRGKERSSIRSTGYVVDTLTAAVWAVGTSKDFSEAVLKAVNLGDDADTVGAVTGQIAGAVWGLSTIPAHWINRLAWRDRLVTTADALWNLSRNS